MSISQAQREAEKKKQELEEQVGKKPCTRCSARKLRVCKCGPGGGGGGSNSDGTDTYDDEQATDTEEDTGGLTLTPTLQPEEIAAMLDQLANFLTIRQDDEAGILAISSLRLFLSPEARLLRNYINMITAELATFKHQLEREGVNLAGYSATLTGSSLVIRIPSVKNYERFIARLGARNLLDIAAKVAKEAKDSEPESAPAHRFSPFSTRLVPVPKGVVRNATSS